MHNRVLKLVSALIFLLFVSVNITASQQHSPLLYNLVLNKNVSDAVIFVKNLSHTSYFAPQQAYMRSEYGQSFDKKYTEENAFRDEESNKLNRLLAINPQSRDILLQIALLSYQNNDVKKAYSFYKRAQSIDPALSLPVFENLQ